MFQSIGLTEWLVVGFILILLFGGKRLPEFFEGLTDAVKEFTKASKISSLDKTESKKESKI